MRTAIRRRLMVLMTLFGLAGVVSVTKADIVVNFDSLSASGSPVSGSVLSHYLQGFGITLSGVTPGTAVTVYDARDLFSGIPGGPPLIAPSPFNVIGQAGSNDPVSYTLEFAQPLSHFSMIRTAVLGTHGTGFAYPEWSATAFDASNNHLGTLGESAFSTFSDIPANFFAFYTPGIRSVRISSNNRHFAAISAVILDDFTFSVMPATVPEPSSLISAALGLAGLAGYAGWRRVRLRGR